MESNNMELSNREETIRLGDLFHVLWKNIILVAIITAVIFVCGIIYTFAIAQPQYSSEATFIVAVNVSGSSDNVDYSNSLRLVETAAQLVTEDGVIDPVAEKHDISAASLKNMVSVQSSSTNFLVKLSVETSDPALSKSLAEDLVESLITFCNSEDSGADRLLQNAISFTSHASDAVYSSPNKVLYLIISLLGGLVVACVAVFIKEFCSTRFRNKDEVERYLGQKVIGYIINDKQKEADALFAKKGTPRPVQLVKPGLRSYEPYNKLLSNIKYSSMDNPYRAIMITSSQERELKSTTIGNFACCIAYNKQKVVLVDADLRKPNQHRLFKVDKNKGIIDYVDGSCTAAEIVKHTEYGVDIVTAGKKVINPLVILESDAFKKLISELKGMYDYVLIDTPPVLACTDAGAVSKACDGVVFNLAIKDVKKKQAAIALQSLNDVQADVIGINITKAEADKDDTAYYYYYNNYYSKDSKEESSGDSEQ